MLEEMEGEDGIVYGVTYLVSDTMLTPLEKIELMLEATSMFYSKEEEKEVKSDYYEGRIWTKRKFQYIGCLGGMRFDAKLETFHGKANLAFLVCDLTKAQNPAFN